MRRAALAPRARTGRSRAPSPGSESRRCPEQDRISPRGFEGGVHRTDTWIDYWSVDWDHKGDAFHNQWQTFRTRKSPRIELSATHSYEESGEYRAVVKVIDILGNDTTKTVKVKREK